MGWEFEWCENWCHPEARAIEANAAIGSGNALRTKTSPFSFSNVIHAWSKAHGHDVLRPLSFIATHSDQRRAAGTLIEDNRETGGALHRALRFAGYDLFDFTEPFLLPSPNGTSELEVEFWSELWRSVRVEVGTRGFRRVDCIEVPRVRKAASEEEETDDTKERAPFLRLDRYDDFEQYMAARKGGFRRQLRRRFKRISETGEIALHVYGPGEAQEVNAWIPKIVQQKETKYGLRVGESVFMNFLKELAKLDVPTGLVQPSAILLDGNPVSWSIDFCVDRCLFLYSSGYDQAFAKYGLGNLHTYLLLERAFQQGMEEVDFLWGDEDYKTLWTDGQSRALQKYSLQSNDPVSVTRRAADRCLRKLGLVSEPQ